MVWNLETIKLRYCHESSRQRFGGSSLEFLHCIDAEFLKEHCPLLLELAGGEQQADKYFQLSFNFDFLLHSFTLLISLLFTPTMRIIQPHHPLVSWFGKHNGTQFYFKRSHSWGGRETELSQTWKKGKRMVFQGCNTIPIHHTALVNALPQSCKVSETDQNHDATLIGVEHGYWSFWKLNMDRWYLL